MHPQQNTNYQLCILAAEEAGLAKAFLNQHCDGGFHCSFQLLLQHHSTVFVCKNTENEWIGLLVTYQSGSTYSTAIVEGIAVSHLHRRKGIALLLINTAIDFWKAKCIFNFSIIPSQRKDCTDKLLQKAGFSTHTKQGYQEYFRRILPEKICLQNRRMRPSMITANGEASEKTLFEYSQQGDTIWGTYAGGEVKRGMLLGKMNPNGNIAFQYMQLNQHGELNTGHSISSTEFLNDGRIALYENWQWSGNKTGHGHAIIEEVKA